MKKQIILLALFVVATLMTFAQNHFAYQAVVRDANGQLLSEKSVTLSWELTHQNGTETGNITATTSKQGLIMVAIAVPEDVVWNGATIKVDVGYGGNTIVGTAQPIFPTPYTLYAEEVNYANLPIVTTITNASDATIPTEGAVKSYGEAISTTLTQNFQAADAALDTRLTDVEIELSNKVDQEAGKGLSSNDYTTAEQQKLAGIEDGAQVNVQSDWAETDNSKAAFIVNKPDFDGAVAAMRAEITNLRDTNANLYDSIAALRARIDELPNIPTLELTASDDYPAAVACGNSITITYTATEIPGATYIWTVDGVAEPTTTHELVKTYTPNFFTETHIVKVVAAFQTATDTTTLSLQSHTAPTVGFCIDDKIGQVFIVTAYSTDKIELFDGATLTKTLTAPLYMADLVLPKELPNGNYTAVASDNDGCTTTYTINVNRVATACTVTNINSNEAGSGEQLTSVRDHEGNEYDVVQIGNQCWMRENMRATTNRDGDNILECPAVSGAYSFSGQKAYKYADSDVNFAKHGILYNWNAAVDTFNHTLGIASNSTSYSDAVDAPFSGNRQGICPTGWHVPTDAEWSTLTDSYSGQAGKLVGGCDWSSSSNGNNPGNYSYSDRNATLASVLPSGYRSNSFSNLGDYASFWSATQGSSGSAYSRDFYCNYAEVDRNNYYKYVAFSVRCVRD